MHQRYLAIDLALDPLEQQRRGFAKKGQDRFCLCPCLILDQLARHLTETVSRLDGADDKQVPRPGRYL